MQCNKVTCHAVVENIASWSILFIQVEHDFMWGWNGVNLIVALFFFFFTVGILARLAEDDQSDMQKQGYEYIRCEDMCIVSCFNVINVSKYYTTSNDPLTIIRAKSVTFCPRHSDNGQRHKENCNTSK